ncbi:MAG: ABC transporter ATP-binding protein [Hyphomicrobiales bacterium]
MEHRATLLPISLSKRYISVNRLVVEHLVAGYGAVTVLRDVSIEVGEGELVAILGTNGNGKSTLLNSILGLVKPSGGRVFLEWDGTTIDLIARPTHRIVDQGIAFVPEGRRVVPMLTVEENLALAGSGPRARAGLRDNKLYCFDTFPTLKEQRNQRSGTLSGGQQQMLAIACALMTSPKLIVIDEPSVGLAPIIVDKVIRTIAELRTSRKMTILMAEQSFFQAFDTATRAYVLTHGRITHRFDRAQGGLAFDNIRDAMLGITA